MRKKNGFTLIELLAVIIILAVLLIIAIPSVSEYIGDSRKRTYISTIKNLISGARNKVNSGKYDMLDPSVSYYIPVECIETESSRETPYGDFVSSYVIANYNTTDYDFYYVGTDTSNMGIPDAVAYDDLDEDVIKAGIKSDDVDTGSAINGRRRIGLLDKTCQTKNINVSAAIPKGDIGKIINKGRASNIIRDDTHDNFRFVGLNPDNYAKFEDSSKIWRIIGYVDGNLKLIDMNGFEMAWDTHYGSEWDRSSLYSYLNTTYYDSLSSKTKDSIAETNWYYNIMPSTEPSNKLVYDAERSGSRVTTGKVALMYGSDYIYATDDVRSSCTETNLFNLNYCRRHWLTSPAEEEWVLLNMGAGRIFFASNNGTKLHPYSGYTQYVRYIRPVVYLKNTIKIKSGTGTSTDPYVFG